MNKITSFIFRNKRKEILLFEHEDGTIQIPAGTIENNEKALDAGIREAIEETGIQEKQILHAELIDYINNDLLNDELVIEEKAIVFSRPNSKSMNWGIIPRGITVKKLKEKNGYVQVKYEDWNNEIDKDYLTYCIIGWIEKAKVSAEKSRHYCILEIEDSREKWIIENDNHVFTNKWVSMDALPNDIYPKNEWIEIIKRYIDRNRPTTAST